MIRPPSNSTVPAYLLLRYLLLLTALFLSGCNEATESPSSSGTTSPSNANATDQPPDQSSFDDGLSADQILAQSLQQYQRAESYSDDAVLYLSYWMNGRPVQEPQPWAVSWQRSGQFAANFYNSQVRCDGRRLSCYVYDIGTANLDGQRLILESGGEIPLTRLFNDEIASHFLGGESEFPLHESNVIQNGGMIPPTAGLLTGQLQPDWLIQATSLVRMADAKIDQRNCYVVRASSSTQRTDIWIDKQSGIIRQIAYPIQWLDEMVQSAPEISELQFVARFHDAKFNSAIDQEVFQLGDYRNSTPVTRFVKLPESIPADTIGQPSPPIELVAMGGRNAGPQYFAGKTTALMWVGDWRSYPGISRLQQLRQQLPADRYNFAVIYADDSLAAPGTGATLPNQQLSAILEQSEIPFYFDSLLAGSTLMKLKSVPAVVILDADSKVQFARELSDEAWVEDVRAALERTDRDEDVSGEMLSDYSRFLDQYHNQLTSVVATTLAADLMPDSAALPDASNSVVARRLWNSDKFQQAGAIATTRSGRLFVLDGWRTVVELDVSGTTVARHQLDLPDGSAVSRIRAFEDRSGSIWTAVFMPSSESVFVFDNDFGLVETVPDTPAGAVLDCRFDPSTGDPVLRVAGKGGLIRLRVNEADPIRFSRTSLQSVAENGQLGISNGEIVILRENNIRSSEGLSYSHIVQYLDGYLAVGETENGTVKFSIVDSNGDEKTMHPVANALNPVVEPVSIDNGSSQGAYCALAGNTRLEIFSGAARSAGSLDTGNAVNGFAIQTFGERTLVVASTENMVSAWEIVLPESGAASTLPASHQREQ